MTNRYYCFNKDAMVRVMASQTRILIVEQTEDPPEPGEVMELTFAETEPTVDPLTVTCGSVQTIGLRGGTLHIMSGERRAALGPTAANNIARGAGFSHGRALRRHLRHLGGTAHLVTFKKQEVACSKS